MRAIDLQRLTELYLKDKVRLPEQWARQRLFGYIAFALDDLNPTMPSEELWNQAHRIKRDVLRNARRKS